jgi:hypothetical protein
LPQKPEYSLSMAQKHELGFDVLSDEGNRVARVLPGFRIGPPLQELYKKKFNTDLAEYNADGTYELPLPGNNCIIIINSVIAIRQIKKI